MHCPSMRHCGTVFLLAVLFSPCVHAQQTSTPAATDAHADATPTERWDDLSIRGSGLKPASPIPGETDKTPEFSRELVRLQWRPNDPVDLYIVRPSGVSKPPVVLFLYGFPSDTDKFMSDAFCKLLVSHGYAAVGFVSALTGARYHDRPMKEWFVSELQESLVTSVHDVQFILDYLDRRGDLDVNRIGMFGQGSGGTIAILSAATDSRIKAVDVLNPWGDWPVWLAQSSQVPAGERGDFLNPAFLDKVAPLDPTKWLPRLAGVKIRLQEASFDTTVPKEVFAQLELALPSNAAIARYNSVAEYHDQASAGGKMLAWLGNQLQLDHDKQKTDALTALRTSSREN